MYFYRDPRYIPRVTKAILLLYDEEEQRNILLHKTQTFTNIPMHEACYNQLIMSIQWFGTVYVNK